MKPSERVAVRTGSESSWQEKKGLMKTRGGKLGLDLDGVITEAPEFFSAWTHSWPGEVVIITYRRDRPKAIQDLADRDIRYDQLVLVDRFEAKAEAIVALGVDFYIDDQPEMLMSIPADVHVMLFRNEGNFDFSDKRWMLSVKTGKLMPG